jgi:hypothetical protein
MATRLERLGSRRIDPSTVGARLANESWRSISQSESVRYVIGAMQPIDPDYTKNTFKQGDRVKEQLEARLKTTCDYEYQGSTTNDTHIKAASDIDLLVLTKKFWGLESPQVPTNPYTGDPVQDLLALREDAVGALKVAFPAAKVDASGSKSIVVTGGSLTRKVDVVPSNWFDTNDYASNKNRVYRGVQILDAHAKQRLENTPFLHNAWVNYRDGETGGGLRKAARLLKSLKFDSEAVDLTSYDLVAIAYNMPTGHLSVQKGQELSLLGACSDYVRTLQMDAALRSSIPVPDGHRKVFEPEHATIAGLNQLAAEIERLVADVLTENKRSFARLAEARVAY